MWWERICLNANLIRFTLQLTSLWMYVPNGRGETSICVSFDGHITQMNEKIGRSRGFKVTNVLTNTEHRTIVMDPLIWWQFERERTLIWMTHTGRRSLSIVHKVECTMQNIEQVPPTKPKPNHLLFLACSMSRLSFTGLDFYSFKFMAFFVVVDVVY